MGLFSFLGGKKTNKKNEYEDYYQDYSVGVPPFIDQNVASREIANDQLTGNLEYYNGITLAGAVLLGEANSLNPYICSSSLRLNGLHYLDEKIARELARFSVSLPYDKGNHAEIELNGLTEIDVGIARGLSTFTGRCLTLRGLKKIDAEVAEALCTNNSVARISLQGLKEIDTETAKAFCNYNGHLSMEGVETASKESLKILAKHFGRNGIYVGRSGSSVRETFESLL